MQNWSCHNCGGCCRQHEIDLTAEEHQRVLAQNWTAADGIPPGQPVVVWKSGPVWNQQYRLAHQPDGACVFLDDKGLCRIHAKFGEAAKPLPCRIYPYTFHPAGKGVTVSLRFSCPSVVSNLGRPVAQQNRDLQEIAALVVPAKAIELPPPEISRGQNVSWPDFRRFTEALEAAITDTSVSMSVRLLRVLLWNELLSQAKFDKLTGGRIGELLTLIRDAAANEVPGWPEQIIEPTPLGRSAFRSLAAIYARKDTATDVSSGWRGRWKLLRAIWGFVRGTGNVPVLQDGFRAVPFTALEAPFGKTTPEIEALMTRYFQVKIRGLHFCGRGFYGLSFTEGVPYLILMWPITLWLARWLAAGDNRTAMTIDDLSKALAVADHNQGFSPLLEQGNARRRVRMLSTTGDLARLCVWYSQ